MSVTVGFNVFLGAFFLMAVLTVDHVRRHIVMQHPRNDLDANNPTKKAHN